MDSRRFRFGLFEFDAAALELRREGALVRLQSQPAQVLACLVECADQVVSLDALRKAVWGNETFVDFERGLNFCIFPDSLRSQGRFRRPNLYSHGSQEWLSVHRSRPAHPRADTKVIKEGSRAAQPFYRADSCSSIRVDRFGCAHVPCLSFPTRPKCNSTAYPRCPAVRQRNQ